MSRDLIIKLLNRALFSKNSFITVSSGLKSMNSDVRKKILYSYEISSDLYLGV